mgnify:CR=1 FL=1
MALLKGRRRLSPSPAAVAASLMPRVWLDSVAVDVDFEVSRLLPAVSNRLDAPPQPGHSRGNSSPARAMSFGQAIRDVSCERGLSSASQPPPTCSPTPLALARAGPTQLAALCGGSTSRTMSVIRAFESVEIPLFSQASMSDVVHSDAQAASNRHKKSSSPQKGDGRMLERGGRSSSESSRT